MDSKLLGFGTSGIGNLYQVIDEVQARTTLQAAWDGGIRVFDTAPLYGHGLSERRVGDFLRAYPRNEYKLSSKVGRLLKPLKNKALQPDVFVEPLPFNVVFDYSYEGIMRSYEDSLQRLGLDRIDLLLIHDIGQYTHKDDHEYYLEQLLKKGGYQALQNLKDAGEVKEIGMGVNESQICTMLLQEMNVDVIVLAGCYNLLRNDSLGPFLTLSTQRKIRLMIAGIFGSGALVARSNATRKFDYKSPPAQILKKIELIQSICDKYAVPVGAVAIHFPLLHPAIHEILVGAQSPQDVKEIIAWSKTPVPSELWTVLEKNQIINAAFRG